MYGGAPRLPFELHRQEFWYTSLLPTAFELCPHNVSRCPRELCAGWLSPTALRCEGATCGKKKPKTSFLYPWLNHSLWSAGHTFRSKVSSEYVRRRPFSLWMMRQAEHRLAPDPGAWMEVLRVGTERWHAHRALRNHEGRNGYGCWFWEARGSGVWINVGAARLAFNDRPAAQQAGMPPGDADYLYARAILARNATTMQITHSNTAIFGGRQTRPPLGAHTRRAGLHGRQRHPRCVPTRHGRAARRTDGEPPVHMPGQREPGRRQVRHHQLRRDATAAALRRNAGAQVPPLSTATTASTCGDVAVHVVADLPAPLANRSCAHGASTSSCMREACCTPGGNKWNNLDVCTAGANSCLGRPFDLGSADAAVASLTYETNEFLLGALFKERLAACSVAPERAELVLVPYLVGELKALRSLGAATIESGYDARVRAQLAQTAAWPVRRLRPRARALARRRLPSEAELRDGLWLPARRQLLEECDDAVDLRRPARAAVVRRPLPQLRALLGPRRHGGVVALRPRQAAEPAAHTAHRPPRRDLQQRAQPLADHAGMSKGRELPLPLVRRQGRPVRAAKGRRALPRLCLLPPAAGHSVCRRGVWDSLFSGCIPVTFPSKAAGIQPGFSLTKIYPWYLSPGTLALVEAADTTTPPSAPLGCRTLKCESASRRSPRAPRPRRRLLRRRKTTPSPPRSEGRERVRAST